jgi:hypothetical protein
VEFALVLPIFVVLLMGTIEFGIAFNALLNVNYSSRNAALLAAEAGSAVGADCVILRSIEQDLGSPSSPARVSRVEIYWAYADGTPRAGNANVYTRGGSKACTFADGTSITVPYTATAVNYGESGRCNIIKGCPNGHAGLDTVGVRITYTHPWVTPMAAFIGGSGSTLTIVGANSMRMEPIL